MNGLQYVSIEDNRTYVFDEVKMRWRKVCDIEADELPPSVRRQVAADQERAEKVRLIPPLEQE